MGKSGVLSKSHLCLKRTLAVFADESLGLLHHTEIDYACPPVSPNYQLLATGERFSHIASELYVRDLMNLLDMTFDHITHGSPLGSLGLEDVG